MQLLRLHSAIVALLGLGLATAAAQISVSGLTDRTHGYANSVTFTINPQAGYDYAGQLDGNPVPVGQPITVAQADYHELRVWATNQTTAAVSTQLYRFNVTASGRGNTENGLPPWSPYPPIPSAPAEVAEAGLRLLMPAAFPIGYDIPVVAWVVDPGGRAVRVNGTLEAGGFPGIELKRGVGSGFLPPAPNDDPLSYRAALHSLTARRDIVPDSVTTWTPVSGLIAGDVTWPANSRIAVTGNLAIPADANLTIEAGTIVRLNHYANITNHGAITIHGTIEQPVVFMPASATQPWGGFFLPVSTARLTATGTLFTRSGALQSGFAGHRSEQCLFYCNNSPQVTLTDSAAIDLHGQMGHAFNGGTFTFTRFLLQRAITGGEYTGATFRVNDSAFLDFPDGTPTFTDGDNDALYLVSGTHGFTNTLIGWTKDDGIDSGGSGPGLFNYQNCWFESTLHEGNSLSGSQTATPHNDKIVNHYDGVFLNCGQGIEDGYGAPTGRVERCLMLGNMVGARFGDNYNWQYYGFLTVRDSILLHNYRDVWGMNFQDWTYRTSAMDVQANYLTAPSPYHPDNAAWDPAQHATLLVPFLTTPVAAPVGVGFATWTSQGSLATLPHTLPVRLSSFTPNTVAVDYQTRSATGELLAGGTLTFPAGSTVQQIPLDAFDAAAHSLVRVSLHNPANAELTGLRTYYFLPAAASTNLTQTPLIPRGATWKYHDLNQDLGTAWRGIDYDDSAWAAGPAELGAGDSNEATPINIGPAGNRFPTLYFRHSFTVTDPAAFGSLNFGFRRDDGGAVYVNGVRTLLQNLPEPYSHSTFTGGDTTSETTYFPATSPASMLVAGLNVCAVEVHQGDSTSSDISFDLEMFGVAAPPPPRLDYADFGDARVLFWTTAGFVLEETTELNGTWQATSTPSPVEIAPTAAQTFYRLRRL